MAMFERFEPAARQAFFDAVGEASRAGQDRIRSEHVLIGLICEPGPAADAMTAAGLAPAELRARLPRGAANTGPLDAEALSSLGIDLDAVRRATDAAFGPGALDRASSHGRRRLPFADDAKQSLAGAVRLAQQLDHRTITSGHMLVGILDQPKSGALAVLSQTGTDVAALRTDVIRRITAQPGG
jgi:ATP-dependent Clp protease ATP-binding subunit ClpA